MATVPVIDLAAVDALRGLKRIEQEYVRIVRDADLRATVGEKVLDALCERYEKLGGDLEALAAYDAAPPKATVTQYPLTHSPDLAEPRRVTGALQRRAREGNPAYSMRAIRALRSGEAPEDCYAAIISANEQYVQGVARKFAKGTGLSLEDLIQEGKVGLLEAARRFDPERHVHFLTYASGWIRNRMYTFIRNSRNGWYVPNNRWQENRRVMARAPAREMPQRLAEASLEQRAMFAISVGSMVEQRPGENRARTVLDITPDRYTSGTDPQIAYRTAQLRDGLSTRIRIFRQTLTEREQFIFTQRITIPAETRKLFAEGGDGTVEGIGDEAMPLWEVGKCIADIPDEVQLAYAKITVMHGANAVRRSLPGGMVRMVTGEALTKERIRQIEGKLAKRAKAYLCLRKRKNVPWEIDIAEFYQRYVGGQPGGVEQNL